MANFKNITEIVVGDTVKTAYKDEASGSDKIFFKSVTVAEIDLDEKSITGTDGTKIYGKFANSAYFDMIEK